MSQLIEKLNFQNPQWVNSLTPPPNFHRQLFSSIWQDLDTKLISLITGPRRVGKSTILKQLIHQLIKNKNISPRQILFVEFSPHQNPDDVWDTYHYFTHNIADSRTPTYLFFDEIQYLNNYESTIKNIYDNTNNTKIFLTGSLSLTYKHKMNESLAGRFFSYPLYPLNFQEYLQLFIPQDTNLFQQALKEPNSLKKQHLLSILNPHFRHFLRYGRYPELSNLSQTQATHYLKNIITQSLNQDVFAYFNIQKPLTIVALYEYLQINNGGIISANKLSKILKVSNQTITEYLNILDIMQLIYPIYNTTNPIIRLNASKKIYVNSSHALLKSKYDTNTALGMTVESYILEQLLSRGELVTFWRHRTKEIDLLLPKKKLGYEIKFRPHPKPLKTTIPQYNLQLITLQNNNPACLF